MSAEKAGTAQNVGLDEVVVQVADNSGSTGYHWEIVDKQGCEVVDTYETPPGPPGAARTRQFDITFEDAPSNLEIDLLPPGSKSEPTERITITRS
ncbi:hypothetical protein [Streptomyces sp. NBRC 110028]|uniref:hypothetical protein n=1 Tax=Streptomyces sp. NBRC 110028 TaxID=1621260 RepID=UPI0006E3FD2B|nr:hypothetical protein [Streptomyces sp. NBRC 110028]